MTNHKTGTHQEWLTARVALLEAEKEHTRRGDELARARQELPWVPIEKDYVFDTDDGPASLADLFRGRSQLLVYHFMFGPEYEAGCPSCSAIADGFNGTHVHLDNHDVKFWAISSAPLEKLQEFKQRMGWSFSWASSAPSDFNHDFGVTRTEEEQRAGLITYNYREDDWTETLANGDQPPRSDIAGQTGTDWVTYIRQGPGMSAFALQDGVVHHTYSAYARGLDGLWGMYSWLDRAPLGRNEPGIWWRHHDSYAAH